MREAYRAGNKHARSGADLVLVLEAGRIVERGMHSELVATSSRYRQLYEMGTAPAEAVNAECRRYEKNGIAIVCLFRGLSGRPRFPSTQDRQRSGVDA